MGSESNSDERIATLSGLLERLANPDLELSEARTLRCRVSKLLKRDVPGPGQDSSPSSRQHGRLAFRTAC